MKHNDSNNLITIEKVSDELSQIDKNFKRGLIPSNEYVLAYSDVLQTIPPCNTECFDYALRMFSKIDVDSKIYRHIYASYSYMQIMQRDIDVINMIRKEYIDHITDLEYENAELKIALNIAKKQVN